jgi:hypothetical protein
MIPSLRRSIPDPLSIDRWPEWTQPTTTDVIVSGVSLLRLVDLCDTPCVHIAAAVVPGTYGRPSDIEQASVVVARVTQIPRPGVLVLDADLDTVTAHLAEARLIGRASTRHSMPFELAHSSRAGSGSLDVFSASVLPADVAVGDLIAVPCSGAVCRREIRLPAGS